MSIVEVVLLTIVLLGLGFVFTQLSRVFRLPHSVFLVIFGILAGVLALGIAAAGIVAATRNVR